MRNKSEKARLLEELYEEIRRCEDCELARYRTNVVPGEGPPDARVMFIGEAPGYHEDRQGRPFVGAAGQFLTRLLASIGLRREDVYICNVIKCRPPQNRDPLPKEIRACAKWLDRQIEIIKPKVIVTLGRYSLNKFLPGASISKVHGTHAEVGGFTIFALHHPAAALHRQELREVIEADFRKLKELLDRVLAEPEEILSEPPRQLSLF